MPPNRPSLALRVRDAVVTGVQVIRGRRMPPPVESLSLDLGMSGNVWDEQVQRAMMPQEVEAILSGALSGDLRDQQRLFLSMMDTWAKLADNVRAVEDQLVSAPWEVIPFKDADGNVTESAKAKAALVEAALHGMTPDPSRQELDRDGLLKGLARGNLTGHAVYEILWEQRLHEGSPAILPRAVRRTGPAHYGYPGNSRLFRFRTRPGNAWQDFPENKFLLHIVPAHEGHPAQAARIRTLAKYWGASTYGFEWLMIYGNKFGMPFRFATYKKESTQLKGQLLAMLANLGTAGYGVFPEGTKIEMHEAGKSAGELPMPLLMKLSDQACDLVIRGETSTGGTGERQGFSKGDVQAGVRRESLQGYCNNAVTTLNQAARFICLLNYGTLDECPSFRCEIPEPEDAKANAETDAILAGLGLPLRMEDLYTRHDKTPPGPGDIVLLNDRLVKWEETALLSDPADAKTKAPAKTMAAPNAAPEVPPPGGKAPPKQLAASKAPAPVTLEDVMEQLLVRATINGAERFEKDAAEVTKEEAARAS